MISTVPAAVFLPPAFEQVPDLAFWQPSDKHLVLEFAAPAAFFVDTTYDTEEPR
jgi:hypothetical protein